MIIPIFNLSFNTNQCEFNCIQLIVIVDYNSIYAIFSQLSIYT